MSYPRMMKSSIVLLVVALSVVAAGHLEQLNSICANDKKVQLTRASDLPDLVSAVKSHPDKTVCSPKIQEALVMLNDLINSNNDDLCSSAHLDRIHAYYKKFVDEDELPKALKNFFLSYGFGVSRVCKTSLISSLKDGRKMLDAADFDQISTFMSDESPLATFVKAPKDVDDIVLPRELGVLLLEKNRYFVENFAEQQVNASIVLQSKAAQFVRNIQSVCARKFQPIYGQLVLPLVSLSRIGLNYKGDDMSSHLKEFKSNKEIHQWYKIVYLCELLRIVEVFEDLEGATEACQKKPVRLLTSEEAEEKRLSQPAVEILGDKVDFHVATGHKPDDLIVDDRDKSMRKLVSRFDVHKSELHRLQYKLLRQFMSLMKKFLMQSKLKLVSSLLKGSINDELDKMASDYIDRLSEQENALEGGHVVVKRHTNQDTRTAGQKEKDRREFNRVIGTILTIGVMFIIGTIIYGCAHG